MTTALGWRHAARTGLLGGARTLTRATLGVPLLVAREAASVPRSAVRRVVPAGGGPVDRQVWAAAGHAAIEVRGLDADGVDRDAAAAGVQRSLAAAPGISWARIDAATGRIAVRYDRRVHTVAGLVELLADAEGRVRAGSDDARGVPAPEPSLPAARDAALLTADAVALVATVGARLAGVPRLPTSLGAAIALAEHQPYLRARIELALGAGRTELVLGLLNASVRAVTRDVPALLLDGSARSVALHAEQARRRVLVERVAELSGPDRVAPTTPRKQDGRPVSLPPGSVDRLAARMSRASLLAAAGLLAGTGNPDLAGRALLVGVPRAAHAARDGFAAGLSIGLADRGVVVTDPDVLHRLDRVTTVVVQSDVLHDVRPLVVDVRADAEGWTTARVWRAAQRLLDTGDDVTANSSPRRALLAVGPGEAPGQGGVPASRRVLTEDGRAVGEVLVGRELDPYADAVLSAVREAGLRLVLTEDVTAADLAGRADEVLRDGSGDPLWLRGQVRRMQADGAVVAVVGFDQEALDAADVGIGVVPADGPAPWAADLLCGPGLVEVPRLVGAVPIARDVSARGVRASLGASFLGGLLLAVGRPGSGGAQLPVTLAALGELVSGVRAGRGVVRGPDPVAVLHTPWHALEPGEVLGRIPDPGPVQATEDPDAPAPEPLRARSLARAGALVSNVRAELADPLTPVLATGAGASAVIGSPTDAFLVGGVLLGSAVISGVQRMRAERALRELLRDQRLPARVVNGDGGDRGAGGSGQPRRVPAAALRPGHLIDLGAGDVVPADARLLTVEELEVDEATLTGESTPVDKDPAATPGADLPDRACMVYEGTTVVAGSGRAVVVATGAATEAGRALALAGRAAAPAGLQARLEELTSRGLPVTLLGGAAVTGLALLRGAPLRTAVSGGVSTAVAAVPEGLPLMATVAQLSAARRLSRRGVLVRSSRTVEALGRVDTVCFDKTGTLTEGRLRLVRTAGLDGPWEPDGPAARRLLRAAAHAGPSRSGQRRLAHATDQAVLDAARALLGADLDEEWQELVEIPFHSQRGFSATLGRTPATVRLVLKGAPEVLLPRCSSVRDEGGKHPLDRSGRGRASAAVRSLAAEGLRVLAVARRNVDGGADGIPDADADDVAGLGDLTLLGFLGLADAPRPEAAATVAALQDAGIATVMITGDHPVTAAAIARQLGIPAEEPVTGPALAALEEPARIARVGRASVFARVSPEQKLQIIEGLRHGGRVVAMAGDGANDAAAIRIADVGIGMAARGSTSARSAADLVFTDPDISLVLDALVEGRAMWQRVRDAVAVLVGGNVGEVAFTLMGTALAGRAPISTRQFLLVNMFTDLLPSMAIALAPTPVDPQDRRALLAGGQPSMGRELLRDIGARGAATSAGALLAWQIGRIGPFRRRASTIALAALVGAELGQTLLLARRDPLVLATALGSAAALVAVIQTPGVSEFFGCTPLDPVAWAIVLACSAAATAASAAWATRAPALPGPERDAQG